MFQRNEYVFYESGGICKITDIQTAPLEGMPPEKVYYIVQSVHDSNGVMYIPVDSDRVFLRPLLSREEAESFLHRIPSVEAIEEPNAKQLRAKYVECMHTHRPEEWVRVIKTVWKRANSPMRRNQHLSETERNFAENAKRYLYAELGLALGKSACEMEAYITDFIERLA